MNCPKCGNQVEEDANCCKICGHNLKEENDVKSDSESSNISSQSFQNNQNNNSFETSKMSKEMRSLISNSVVGNIFIFIGVYVFFYNLIRVLINYGNLSHFGQELFFNSFYLFSIYSLLVGCFVNLITLKDKNWDKLNKIYRYFCVIFTIISLIIILLDIVVVI